MGKHIRSAEPGSWTLVEEMPDFGAIFTDDAVNRIAEEGGIQIPRDKLIEVARNYLMSRHARQRPPAAADRATLERITALANELDSEIASLPETVLPRLWRVSSRSREVLASLEVNLPALASWATAAAPPVTTGRPADTHIQGAVDALAGLYHKSKGERPGARPDGPFARLVVAFFEVVDSKQCVSGDTVRWYVRIARRG